MSIQTPFPVLGGGVLHLLGRRFWVVMSTEGVNLVSGLPLFNLEPTLYALPDWPGNIRELENLVERAYILETSTILTPESFPNQLMDREASTVNLPLSFRDTLGEFRQKSIEDAERLYLKNALKDNKGKIKDTAATAGITTRQLSKLLKKYEIKKEEFKPPKHPI